VGELSGSFPSVVEEDRYFTRTLACAGNWFTARESYTNNNLTSSSMIVLDQQQDMDEDSGGGVNVPGRLGAS